MSGSRIGSKKRERKRKQKQHQATKEWGSTLDRRIAETKTKREEKQNRWKTRAAIAKTNLKKVGSAAKSSLTKVGSIAKASIKEEFSEKNRKKRQARAKRMESFLNQRWM